MLVADDNADMRAYLNRILNKAYRVMLASDGAMALEQARTTRPELILTDVMMPQMSGYDLLREVRKDAHLQTTPVIFLTARAGTEARIESLEAGADDYIAKPFDEHEVLARVGNLIRARAQERQLHELQMEKLSKFLPAPIAGVLLSHGAGRSPCCLSISEASHVSQSLPSRKSCWPCSASIKLKSVPLSRRSGAHWNALSVMP